MENCAIVFIMHIYINHLGFIPILIMETLEFHLCQMTKTKVNIELFLTGDHRHHFARNILFGKHVEENKELREIGCQMGKQKNVTLSQSIDDKFVEHQDADDLQSRCSQYVGGKLLHYIH